MIDLNPLVHRILEDYVLRWDGTHGVGHWARAVDRLGLGHVGMVPGPTKLYTPAARMVEMIRWADGRAAFEVVPELAKEEWGMMGTSNLLR